MKKHDWQKKIVVNYRERQERCPGREGGREGWVNGWRDGSEVGGGPMVRSKQATSGFCMYLIFVQPEHFLSSPRVSHPMSTVLVPSVYTCLPYRKCLCCRPTGCCTSTDVSQ